MTVIDYPSPSLWSTGLLKNIIIFSDILMIELLFSPPFLDTEAAAATAAKLLQSCLTLCDPIDGSPPGSPWWKRRTASYEVLEHQYSAALFPLSSSPRDPKGHLCRNQAFLSALVKTLPKFSVSHNSIEIVNQGAGQY